MVGGALHTLLGTHLVDLPGMCGADEAVLQYSCYSSEPIAPGDYTLTAQALLEPGCSTGSADECDCSPGSMGSCETNAYVPLDLEYERVTDGLAVQETIAIENGAEIMLVFR